MLVPDYATLAGWRTSRDNAATARGSLTVDAFQAGRPAPVPVDHRVDAARLGDLQRRVDQRQRRRQVVAGAQGARRRSRSTRRSACASTSAPASKRCTTQNVVAVYEGGDPALKQEYVALGAHYDHIGVSTVGHRSHQQRRRRRRVGHRRAAEHGRGAGPRQRADASGRGCSSGTPAKRRGCGARATSSSTRPCRSTRSSSQLNVDMIGRSRKPGDRRRQQRADRPERDLRDRLEDDEQRARRAQRARQQGLPGPVVQLQVRRAGRSQPLLLPQRSLQLREEGHPDHLLLLRRARRTTTARRTRSRPSTSARWRRVARTIYATAYALAELPARPAVDRKLPAQLSTDE